MVEGGDLIFSDSTPWVSFNFWLIHMILHPNCSKSSCTQSCPVVLRLQSQET